MSSSRASSTAAVQTTVRYRYVLNRVRRRPVARSRARERDCIYLYVRPFYAHSITRTDADARGDASRSQSRDPGGDLPRSRMKKAARRNNEEMAGSRRNTNRGQRRVRDGLPHIDGTASSYGWKPYYRCAFVTRVRWRCADGHLLLRLDCEHGCAKMWELLRRIRRLLCAT